MNAQELNYSHFTSNDEAHIKGLFEASFSRKMSDDLWKWRFLDNPHGIAIINLAWDKELLVGHYAVSKCRLNLGGKEFLSGLSGTTMTHPSYRGLGLFPKLAEKTYARMRDDGMIGVWGFPNSNSHRGFVKDLKWIDIYEIPVFRLKFSNNKIRIGDVEDVFEVTALDKGFDELWQEVSRGKKIMVRRDAEHLKWRYLDNIGSKYRFVVVRRDEKLLGYAVFKRYENELQVVDILAMPDMWIGMGLIQHCVDLAMSEGCSSIGMWLSVHDPLHHELERAGFCNDGPVTYFGGRVFDGAQGGMFYDFRNWHITMGDSDVY